MIRKRALPALCCALLVAACSRQESSETENDVPAGNRGVPVLSGNAPAMGTNAVDRLDEPDSAAPESDLAPLLSQLEAMRSVERMKGQALLTGKSLVFDYDRRDIRMEKDVVVTDDQGTMKTQTLIGRFSVSNTLDVLEADGGVWVQSADRNASAGKAIYDYRNGRIQMEEKASVSVGGNSLSGEQITLWVTQDRRLICEPNALLVVTSISDLKLDSSTAALENETEVRADRVTYDQSKGEVEVVGNVRLRDSRAAMNCAKIRLILKDTGEIDWIEAGDEVIIQTENRKALADRATYYVNEGKFTLEGSPKVKLGLNIMTGDRITFWHATQRMVCEPNARVVLQLDEATRAKFLKDLKE